MVCVGGLCWWSVYAFGKCTSSTEVDKLVLPLSSFREGMNTDDLDLSAFVEHNS